MNDLNKLARAQGRSFRLEFDVNYGIDRKTGWSVICDGRVIVQFSETPEEALKEAAKKLAEEEPKLLRFGELSVEECFISFPLPGDNDGHGGYRGAYRVFRKKLMTAISTQDSGTATDGRGSASDFPNTMPVIKVL